MSNDTTKPAILSAERLAQYRAMVDGFSPHPTREPVLAAVAALLAHIDALTAGEVDAEALGRLTRRARYDAQGIGDAAERAMPWATLADEDRAVYSFIGSALYTLGRAAGRSEGEVERAQLDAQIVNNEAVARESIEAAHEEIARLTAELAEARTRIERIHDEHRTEIGRWVKAETAARLDGARVEREACADWIRRECLPVTADRMIEARARGEGSPT